MVGRGKSCWLPLSPAAGWASILPGLGEGRSLPSGSCRLWEPSVWFVLNGKVWVQWGGQIQWGRPLSCLRISGMILSSMGRGRKKYMSVWLADQGSLIFLMRLRDTKLEGEGPEHLGNVALSIT